MFAWEQGVKHILALGYSVCDPLLCDMIWYDLEYAVALGEQEGQDGCCSNAPRCGSERFFAKRGMATVPSTAVALFGN
jgi:hypothetical protein